jgi:shikimate dehydrogenase
MEQARADGAALQSDCLGMLVEQAAESFEIWHGVMPDTQPVLTALRASLQA